MGIITSSLLPGDYHPFHICWRLSPLLYFQGTITSSLLPKDYQHSYTCGGISPLFYTQRIITSSSLPGNHHPSYLQGIIILLYSQGISAPTLLIWNYLPQDFSSRGLSPPGHSGQGFTTHAYFRSIMYGLRQNKFVKNYYWSISTRQPIFPQTLKFCSNIL